ncbi:MAG: hypothetical protein LBH43_03410, partial [Treponema sp.]|nr:hypothetical protein [Treponema sp.]
KGDRKVGIRHPIGLLFSKELSPRATTPRGNVLQKSRFYHRRMIWADFLYSIRPEHRILHRLSQE